ncbi:expressed unknown protein (Partial), partial [Seminavis robusta]
HFSLRQQMQAVTIEQIRFPYERMENRCNQDPDTKYHVAKWNTILTYWGESAIFHGAHWALHKDLPKGESVRLSLDLAKKTFKKHGDLKYHVEHVMLPKFLESRMPTDLFENVEAERLSRVKELELKRKATNEKARARKQRNKLKKNPTAQSQSQSGGNNKSPVLKLPGTTLNTRGSSPEQEVIMKTKGSSQKKSQPAQEAIMNTTPQSSMKKSQPAQIEMLQEESDDESDGDWSKSEGGDDSLSKSDDEILQSDEEVELKDDVLYDGGPLEVDESNNMEQSNDEDDPVVVKSIGFGELVHFVNDLCINYHMVPISMSKANKASVKTAMVAWGWHEDERDGEGWKDYVKNYQTWVPAIHKNLFENYLSSFVELLTATNVKGDSKIYGPNKAFPRANLNELIQDYLEDKMQAGRVDSAQWRAILEYIQGEEACCLVEVE